MLSFLFTCFISYDHNNSETPGAKQGKYTVPAKALLLPLYHSFLPSTAVLRETRPVQTGAKRAIEERKEAPKVVAGTALAHAVGSGSVTVSVTGTVPGTLKIPEPVIVPVTVPLPPQSPYDPPSTLVQEQDGLSHLREVTVKPTRRCSQLLVYYNYFYCFDFIDLLFLSLLSHLQEDEVASC